jgi:uncharacterized protein
MGEAGGDDSACLKGRCCSVFNVDRRLLIGTHVRVPETSRSRRDGLLGMERLEEEAGIWIAPCEAIHTFGMKMHIDVVFLDRALRVRKVRPDLGPARISLCLAAYSVLELAPGVIARSGTEVGDQLQITEADACGR